MNSFNYLILLVVLSLVLSGCNNRQSQVAESAEANNSETSNSESNNFESNNSSSPEQPNDQNSLEANQQLSIPLKVTRLCGNDLCQPYQAAIKENQVSFAAVDTVLANGNHSSYSAKKLTEKSVAELNHLIAGLKLVSLNTKLTPGQKQCMNSVTDQPTYKIELDKGQFPQTLELYTGCNNMPNKYRRLLQWITNTLESNASA